MTDAEIGILVNAVVGLLVAITLWINARIKSDLTKNTEATKNVEHIVNGERTVMLEKMAVLEGKGKLIDDLEEKVKLLTSKILKEQV